MAEYCWYLLHAALISSAAAVSSSVLVSESKSEMTMISSPCSTNSMIITTLTPCLNYVTGSSSSSGGSPPTQDCCDSLRSVMISNMDCFCLILTGNVPLSIPFINPTSLSKLCRNSVPLQCKASGVPLPPAGPALFGPTQPPSSPATTSAAGAERVAEISPSKGGSH